MGPTLGGYLTDAYNWRWVFYVNVPFGIAAVTGIWLFFKDTHRDSTLKFDWFGFAVLGVGLGALQLMLDRGTTQGLVRLGRDHHRSVVGGSALYLFVVHMFTSEQAVHPARRFSRTAISFRRCS